MELGLPPAAALPTPEAFGAMVRALDHREPPEMGALWDYVERFAFPKRRAEDEEAAAMPLFAMGAQLA